MVMNLLPSTMFLFTRLVLYIVLLQQAWHRRRIPAYSFGCCVCACGAQRHLARDTCQRHATHADAALCLTLHLSTFHHDAHIFWNGRLIDSLPLTTRNGRREHDGYQGIALTERAVRSDDINEIMKCTLRSTAPSPPARWINLTIGRVRQTFTSTSSE